MKRILGLDLGTNSIGWAVIDKENNKIEAAGSRIIPMDAGRLGDFEKGNSISFTADRTKSRGMRRLIERQKLRRERLLRVLNIMNFLPEHFASQINRYGKFTNDDEPKLAWRNGKDGKPEFIFKNSFDEMVAEFIRNGIIQKIPYDWTIYYLRKKALSSPLTKEELAWVLLQFNQKRGYYQPRSKMDAETENDEKKSEEYHELRVTTVEKSNDIDEKKGQWYNLTLENGWIYRRTFRIAPDWEGKIRPFIATFKLDKNGNRKEEQPSLRSPNEDDWGLQKIRTQHKIDQSKLTIGEYIYNTLLNNPNQKIIGETVRTVDRHYYLDEIHTILNKQKEFIPELNNRDLYKQCIDALYHSNEPYRNSIEKRDFTYLLADNILFYQRPLKSKASLINNCPFENYGEWPIKCIAKSHPLYQEFRLWQFISNLKIYCEDKDITTTYLPDDNAYTNLYDFLADQKAVEQNTILKYFKIGKDELSKYRWNYVPDKKYPAGETRAILLGGFKKAGLDSKLLDSETELRLWHHLYSIDDPLQYEKALRKSAKRMNLDNNKCEAFVQAFRKLTVYKEKEYGAYSAKAIKRLLPLMRRGKYWSANNIDAATRSRIDHIIDGEYDETISTSVREKFNDKRNSINQYQGLNTWQACYIVYNRHSEATDAQKWTKPEDIDLFLKQFRHNSLNNPVVEQIVIESLKVVHDIWLKYGHPDEIHLELGRELKKTNDERKRLSTDIANGETTNQRIRLLLSELINPEYNVEDVRPYSPKHHELMKIYEDGVWSQSDNKIFNNELEKQEIENIQKRFTDEKKQPTHAEILRYKLWLDQKYISPYTGKPIPLSKLFTTAYQIEHIIPQSRWFDDSITNKVICEAEVNQLKDRELGFEFIKNHHGEMVQLTMGDSVEILSIESYEELVNNLFEKNKKKRERLLLDEIPEGFTSRQLNDTRYITRLMMALLSNIVRNEDEEGIKEGTVTSKNVIPCNGSITDRLKKDWGINDIWNRIILPRFERMNNLTETSDYTTISSKGHTIPDVPIELKKSFNKKRIDHRHHAMDAIVIACCTREHVSLLNNEAANSDKIRYDLQQKLREKEYFTNDEGAVRERFSSFTLPWESFPLDVYNTIQNIIVSFKQNLRIINKTSNYYTFYDIESTNKKNKKNNRKQEKGDNWSIRKPLHKDTVFGEVNLQLTKMVRIKEALANIDRIVSRELKEKIKEKKALSYTDKQILEYLQKNKEIWSEAANGKIEIYYYTKETNKRYFATRKKLIPLMKDCSSIDAAEKIINSITDKGIQSILRSHLSAEMNNPIEAFSADGIERMNQNIRILNNGKEHKPIKSVRVFEEANKFSIGTRGAKSKKFVEGAKGTNLFFVIYSTIKNPRCYTTLPLNIVIELQKRYKKTWKEHIVEVLSNDIDAKIIHVLSPGDLVYVPENNISPNKSDIDKNRIYKVVSMNGSQLMCIPHNVASHIDKDKPIDKKKENIREFTTSNKMERAVSGEMIKEVCVPIEIDRLGNIVNLGQTHD